MEEGVVYIFGNDADRIFFDLLGTQSQEEEEEELEDFCATVVSQSVSPSLRVKNLMIENENILFGSLPNMTH